MTTMEYMYRLLPLFIVLLAYKWPRITLILVCLLLKWWIAAVGVIIVSLLARFSINFKRMTQEEYDKYLRQKQENDNS